mmetsp:Transcript_15062/g.23340  ORF Transcript_15062/g.23340 Transcript_15062/m.23340 type:complete len:379 (-) Transcript_15062:373-1509(-)
MMKRQLQTTIGILIASLLLCVQQHHCDAAPTFAKRRSRAIKMNTSSTLMGDKNDNRSSSSYIMNFTPRASSQNKQFKLIRGGNINHLLQSTVLPIISTIVGQSLNVAMATLVASGYVGCYIASVIIRHLQLYCKNGAAVDAYTTVIDGNNGHDGFTLHRYKWTILASLTHIILSNHSKSNNDSSNPTFLPTLWAYSHTINPTLGGYIGCTHLLLGGVSSLLGSKGVVDRLCDLMKVRLPPLDEFGNMSYNVDTFQETKSKNGGVGVVRQVLVRIVSSCGIFTSFPRDSLSLYMGTSALLTYIISLDLNYDDGMWKKVVSDQISWWRGGLLGGIVGGGGYASAADMVVDTNEVTMRLFVMHWIVMLVKGTTSALLLQRL